MSALYGPMLELSHIDIWFFFVISYSYLLYIILITGGPTPIEMKPGQDHKRRGHLFLLFFLFWKQTFIPTWNLWVWLVSTIDDVFPPILAVHLTCCSTQNNSNSTQLSTIKYHTSQYHIIPFLSSLPWLNVELDRYNY